MPSPSLPIDRPLAERPHVPSLCFNEPRFNGRPGQRHVEKHLDSAHNANLLGLFSLIVLVDAHGVDPEVHILPALCACWRNWCKSSRTGIEQLPIEQNVGNGSFIAPSIREDREATISRGQVEVQLLQGAKQRAVDWCCLNSQQTNAVWPR